MNLKNVTQICLTGLILAGCACSDVRKPEADKRSKQKKEQDVAEVLVKSQQVNSAAAKIHAVKGGQEIGLVSFTRVPGGIRIVADIDGLTPGKHGFHVHEHGDCGGDGASAAGGHFNPTSKKHGGPDDAERHVGDFGNIEVDDSGHGHYDRIDKIIAFEGDNNIIGRSIIIHVGEDDLKSQPTGNSGARFGCGIIQASQ